MYIVLQNKNQRPMSVQARSGLDFAHNQYKCIYCIVFDDFVIIRFVVTVVCILYTL